MNKVLKIKFFVMPNGHQVISAIQLGKQIQWLKIHVEVSHPDISW